MEYIEFWAILFITIIILLYYGLCKLYTKLFIIENMLFFERNSKDTDFYSEAKLIIKRYKKLPLPVRFIIRRDYFEDLIYLVDDKISSEIKPAENSEAKS